MGGGGRGGSALPNRQEILRQVYQELTEPKRQPPSLAWALLKDTGGTPAMSLHNIACF